MRVPYPLLLLLFSFACGKKEAPPAPAPPAAPPAAPAPVALTVKAVTLGKGVGADKRVVQATDTFGPKDAIYASVETEGPADQANLEAKWTFSGAKGPVAVKADAMRLANLQGTSVNEFHITKKTDWPKGAYQVEILVNGVSAVKKDFTVQ